MTKSGEISSRLIMTCHVRYLVASSCQKVRISNRLIMTKSGQISSSVIMVRSGQISSNLIMTKSGQISSNLLMTESGQVRYVVGSL